MLADLLPPIWDELLARTDGPLQFRFILQPTMATLLAIRDGYRDAAAGRPPYLQDILRNPAMRAERLREGCDAVARVMLLGVAMDAAYQFQVIGAFRPLEMAIVVLLLAFVPYLLIRGPARRVFQYYILRKTPASRKNGAQKGGAG